MNDLHASIEKAAQWVRSADALVVCAGAGMGVDSGLPDFRGDAGFWRAYPALGRARMGFADAASAENFRRDPRLAWGFYGHRLRLYRDTEPHEGFALLRRWAGAMRGGCWVFTSNVDGQFQKAGFPPGWLKECHGSIHHLQCTEACRDAIWPATGVVPDVDVAQCLWRGELPRCPHCGAVARPNILMFEDWGWNPMRRQSQATAQRDWMDGLRQKACKPVVIEIGAGTAIASVRHFATKVVQDFRQQGARLIRINPREPDVVDALDVGLPLGALAALRAIDGCASRSDGTARPA